MQYWDRVLTEVVDKPVGRMLTNLYQPEGEKAGQISGLEADRDEVHTATYPLTWKDEIIQLTFREAQCAYFMIKGLSFKEIAERLWLSPRTIEYYLRRLRKKFECTSKLEVLKILNRTEFCEHYSFE